MLNTSETPRLQATIHFSNLVEVFVDAFIGATNNISKEHLEHFSRVVLFGVHLVFLLLEVSGRHGEDPVSQKKLDQGDVTWEYTKEIMGWLVDGADFTLRIMPEKCVRISKLIKSFANNHTVHSNIFRN